MKLTTGPTFTHGEIYAGLNSLDDDRYVKSVLTDHLQERLLNERLSSAIISSTASRISSSLNIKVSGGDKKTTPLPRAKDKRARRSNQSSNNTGDDHYQKNNGDIDDNYGTSKSSNHRRRNRDIMEGKENDGGGYKNKRDRGDSTFRSESFKSRRNSHQGKNLSSTDSSDNLEVPIGQWVVIICVLLGMLFHHFNLGAKFSLLLNRKNNVHVESKKKIHGKKVIGKKGKKRIIKKGIKPKDIKADEKDDYLEINSTSSHLASTTNSTRKNKKINKVDGVMLKGDTNRDVKQNDKSKGIGMVDNMEKEKKINEGKESNYDESTNSAKKRKKGRKTQKNDKIQVAQKESQSVKAQPKDTLPDGTPDSVSTDGSSSTEDNASANNDSDNLRSQPQNDGIETQNALNKGEDDNGHDKGWVTVNSATDSKRQDISAEKNDNSPVLLKGKPSKPGQESCHGKNDVKLEASNKSDKSAAISSDPGAKGKNITDGVDQDNQEAPVESKEDISAPDTAESDGKNSTKAEVDDEAYARMLQDQEAELAKSGTAKKSSEQNWEEVPSKKKKKSGK